jgi:SOS-response transcriptional repressor LexA/DNA-binding XRE family transcriptional regulator
MASRKTSVPEWARKIQQLRQRLALSQTAFGSRLHYSAMAVSRWESGTQEPPAQCYIQLGNLAGEPDCWMFWARAGLKSSDLSRLFPQGRISLARAKSSDIDVVVAGSGERRQELAAKAKLVAVPLLPIQAATRGETGDQQTNFDQVPAEEMLATPFAWCPNPTQTSCIRAKDKSMSPLIADGDIVAVDYSQTAPADLSGKIVVAWHREHGLSLHRFLFVQGVQMLDSENRDFPPIVLEKDRNWRIIGKVLWWIHKAP